MRAAGSSSVHVVIGSWDRLRPDAWPIRLEVFVQEQFVPPELELDEYDPLSQHAVAYDLAGQPLATGRLLPDGHIGRMAVRRSTRGSGVGAQVLTALIACGRQAGHKRLILNAQIQAMGFYEAFGFAAEGEIFLDAGIEHRVMVKPL